MSNIKFVFALACLVALVTRMPQTVTACRCMGLPPPAYCRVDWLAVLKITGVSYDEEHHKRHYAFQLLNDLTPVRAGAGGTLKGASDIETGFTSAECGANLDVNSTYLIGGQFSGVEENYKPHINTCHAFLQDWQLSGEKATQQLGKLRKECEQFRANHHPA